MTAHSRFDSTTHIDELRIMDDVRMPLGGVPFFGGDAMLEDTAVAVIEWYGAGYDDWHITDIVINGRTIGPGEPNPFWAGIRREILDYIDGGNGDTLACKAAADAWERAHS